MLYVFFLYSSSFVFYLKCKLVRVDVPFVFKVQFRGGFRGGGVQGVRTPFLYEE